MKKLFTIMFIIFLSLSNISIYAYEDYDGDPYIEINDNQPIFTKKDKKRKTFEYYSNLDELGRAQYAFANLSQDLMPTEERSSIGMIKPSGWHTVRYDGIDGKYLYNRCHLIGYQLSGENANEKNLITGTRYLNIEGMLPFENEVADYIKKTDHHVLYRATPIYEGENLVASGVTIEAYSIEDKGQGICFNVYCYNVQPGIEINYSTGDSKSIDDTTTKLYETKKYIINKNTKVFHLETCASVDDMKESNKQITTQSKNELIKAGYKACKRCDP